jgi:hypothetical protein
MPQGVSRRRLPAEVRVRARVKSVWDLWWTKWHWDSFFLEFLGFLLSISLRRGSLCSYVKWEMNNRPVGGRSSVLPL